MENKYREAINELLSLSSYGTLENQFSKDDLIIKVLQELVDKHENIKNTLNKVISERLNQSKKVLERDEICYIQALQFVLKLLEFSEKEMKEYNNET